MPHKRKQPDTDTDTGSPGSPGSAVPRVLVARKPSGGRAFNGPEGWFPRAGVSYETMREFSGASKSSKPPASEADLKVARQAVVDAWQSLDKDELRHCVVRTAAITSSSAYCSRIGSGPVREQHTTPARFTTPSLNSLVSSSKLVGSTSCLARASNLNMLLPGCSRSNSGEAAVTPEQRCMSSPAAQTWLGRTTGSSAVFLTHFFDRTFSLPAPVPWGSQSMRSTGFV